MQPDEFLPPGLSGYNPNTKKIQGVLDKKTKVDNKFFIYFKTDSFEVVAIMDKINIASLEEWAVTRYDNKD